VTRHDVVADALRGTEGGALGPGDCRWGRTPTSGVRTARGNRPPPTRRHLSPRRMPAQPRSRMLRAPWRMAAAVVIRCTGRTAPAARDQPRSMSSPGMKAKQRLFCELPRAGGKLAGRAGTNQTERLRRLTRSSPHPRFPLRGWSTVSRRFSCRLAADS